MHCKTLSHAISALHVQWLMYEHKVTSGSSMDTVAHIGAMGKMCAADGDHPATVSAGEGASSVPSCSLSPSTDAAL